MRRFSILTPTRDRADWLPRCIESVQAQSFTDFEHIIFDNGRESVEHLVPDDPRFTYFRGTVVGPAEAFDVALQVATGEIVHPLSDDDRLTPDALEVVDREIGGAAWLTALTSYEDLDGKQLLTLGGKAFLGKLQRKFYLGGAIYWKRELSDRVGGFDLDFDGAADYELYLRFAQEAPAMFVDQVLYRYTEHPGTDTNAQRARQDTAVAAIRERIAA